MKRMMLYFGSFNPAHKGHIALAEYVVAKGLCDEVALIVSPQSPYKTVGELAPEMDRFEMVELACAASKYPERIKASCIEFILPSPSYTIETLRHLKENYGSGMEFSILLGADQLAAFDGWKEYEEILRDYPVYIYPRSGEGLGKFADRVTLLADAPLQEYSSTQVRERLAAGDDVSAMLAPEVEAYIRKKKLWSPEVRMKTLTERIDAGEATAELFVERGKLHFRLQTWGEALNDFNRALKLDDNHAEARQYAHMVQEILKFRYKDIYNP